MALNPKQAMKEKIRKKLCEGIKASALVAQGHSQELVNDVKCEENNERDRREREQVKIDQQNSMSAKRDRQYTKTMTDLGQTAGDVKPNVNMTAPAASAAIGTGQINTGDDQSNSQSAA